MLDRTAAGCLTSEDELAVRLYPDARDARIGIVTAAVITTRCARSAKRRPNGAAGEHGIEWETHERGASARARSFVIYFHNTQRGEGTRVQWLWVMAACITNIGSSRIIAQPRVGRSPVITVSRISFQFPTSSNANRRVIKENRGTIRAFYPGTNENRDARPLLI